MRIRLSRGAFALLIVACAKREPTDDSVKKSSTVHTDKETVEKYVALPGVVAVRWVESSPVPHGPRDLAPGPTDWALTAYVELDPGVWAALDERLGGPKSSETMTIDEDWAEEILTPRALAELPREGDHRIVQIREYDIGSIRKGTRTGNRASRIGSGLLMSFSTN